MAVVVHTHETSDEGGILGRGALQTATVELSGTLAGGASVDLTLQPYTWVPMFYATQATLGVLVFISGHSVDPSDPDDTRLRLHNQEGLVSHNYALDYRYMEA